MPRCLFCRRPFPGPDPELPPALPAGRRFAFDPERGRLWLICAACRRWSLWPLEERAEALEALERLARSGARVVYRTDNVALLDAGSLRLLRVGAASLPEQAWWRYGTALRRRRREVEARGLRVRAASLGAASLLARRVGLAEHAPHIVWDDAPLTELLRWRIFGWAAWRGGRRCTSCGSVLRALPYDLTWWLYPRVSESGALQAGIPCPRCDPWTPEKVYVLEGEEAATLLRRALAWQHVRGAPDERIGSAAGTIEEAGSASAYLQRAGRSGVSLWSLGPVRALALEIALNEERERRVLQEEAEALERTWREEEELARIVDEELSAWSPPPPALPGDTPGSPSRP